MSMASAAPPRRPRRPAEAAEGTGGADGRLEALQGLRAMAALVVVAFHLAVDTMPEVLARPGAVWPGLGMGYAGVDVFFVLSGFIMVIVHQRDFGVPGRAGRFLWKRASRIYPIYWVVLALLVPMQLAFDGPSTLPDAEALLKALALVPNGDDPVMVVAWTLSFELLFYLMFSLVILSRRLGGAVVGAWFAAVAAAAVAGHEGWGSTFLLSPYNLLFLFGMLAAWGYRALPVPVAAAAAIGGAALFLAVGLSEPFVPLAWVPGGRTVLFGLAGLGMVAGLAALDRRGAVGTPRVLALLGDASYSIYLVHMIVLTAAARVLRFAGLDAWFPDAALAALLFAGSVAAGVVLYLAVERPLMRRLRVGPRWARAGGIVGSTP